jgi:hypothetical protein
VIVSLPGFRGNAYWPSSLFITPPDVCDTPDMSLIFGSMIDSSSTPDSFSFPGQFAKEMFIGLPPPCDAEVVLAQLSHSAGHDLASFWSQTDGACEWQYA